jgi:hypothetical protein
MAKRRETTKSTRRNLYEVAKYLRSATKQELGTLIPFHVYLKDPRVAELDQELGFDKEFLVRWEPGLADGPTSSRFAIVDFNGDSGNVAPKAKWDGEREQFLGPGGEVLDSQQAGSFQFHQLNVWATLQRALDYFEEGSGLGRPLSFGFEGNRLIVLPHAGYGKNAYYDRASKSLQFYYFDHEGRHVYTCLSADIINHEFAHAVLDGIRPHLIESPATETAAFHEFLGDLSAVLLNLRNNTFRRLLARDTEGRLENAEHVADIAREFGEAVKDRPYLRTARSPLKMAEAREIGEAHQMSQVLTAAMFDILTAIANHHVTHDRTPAEAFWFAADRMQRTAIQPLDLLPPCDLTFKDYALAILRSLELSTPKDPNRYYEMMLDVFREREILSDDEVRMLTQDRYLYEPIHLDVFHDISDISRSRAEAYEFLHDNRNALMIPDHQDVIVSDLYDAQKLDRAGRRLPRQIILVYIWREELLLEGAQFGDFSGRTTQMLCGGTLVFDAAGNVLSWARKPGTELPRGTSRFDAENLLGEQRKQQLLTDLARRIQSRRVGAVLGSSRGILGSWVPPMVVQEDGGVLRFELSPHLNVSDDNEEGFEGDRRWQISS